MPIREESIAELSRAVLSGLAQAYDDDRQANGRMKIALSYVQSEFFSGTMLVIWETITSYYSMVGGTPSPNEFDEMVGSMASISLAEANTASGEYHRYLSGEATMSDRTFEFACRRLQSAWRDSAYSDVLSNAQKALHGTVSIDGSLHSGFEDSVSYLRKQIGVLESLDGTVHSESTIADAADEIWREYRASKLGAQHGILTGWPTIDSVSGGIKPGELWFFAAYLGTGKSKMMYCLAHNAAVIQKKHTLFVTVEATVDQVRRNVVIRHTHMPQFEREGGLSYTAMMRGLFDQEDEQVLRAVVEDLKDGAVTNRYGRLFITQLPKRATVSQLREVISQQSKLQPVDLVIVDYLGLFGGDQRRRERREELDDTVSAAKRLATDGIGGHPIALVSPWQISRDAHSKAAVDGHYKKASMAETSQVERSADMLIGCLRPDNDRTVLHCDILKYRDGADGQSFDLYPDYDACIIREHDAEPVAPTFIPDGVGAITGGG